MTTDKAKVNNQSKSQALIEQLHDHPASGYFNLAGGGVSGLNQILSVPGASRSVLGAEIPYSGQALLSQLGSLVASACSEETAAAMAAYAFEKAYRFASDTPIAPFGLSCTAALATDRTRRGEDRAYIALQNLEGFCLRTLKFSKTRNRAEQEAALGSALIDFLAVTLLDREIDQSLANDNLMEIEDRAFEAERDWRALVSHEVNKVERGGPVRALLPGAFNPIHQGHQEMARLAALKLSAPVHFELSITNVDKPPLSYWHLHRRVEQLEASGHYVLTRAPTFREKAALFPNTWFVVGADTLARIDQDQYYASAPDRLEAIASIEDQGCKFLVFGRMMNGSFTTLRDLSVSNELMALCEGIDEDAFRQDISSSALRSEQD